MSRLTTHLYTAFLGRFVGKDNFGNGYYQRGSKRWVVYKRGAEPSTVPPEWHGWLHHVTDETPIQYPGPDYPWIKPAQPNRTGTPAAYLPAGHLLKGAHHQPTTSQYEPWVP